MYVKVLKSIVFITTLIEPFIMWFTTHSILTGK